MSHPAVSSVSVREGGGGASASKSGSSSGGGGSGDQGGGPGGDYYKTVWNTGEESVTSVAAQAGKTRLARERVASILRETEMRSPSDVEATFMTSSSRGGRSAFADLYNDDDVIDADNDDDELQLDPVASQQKKPARNTFFKHLKQLQQARDREGSRFSAGLVLNTGINRLAGDDGPVLHSSDVVTSDAVSSGQSCLPAEGLEWSMSDDDDEPILDLLTPEATARPRPTSGLRTLASANVQVEHLKAFSRKLVFKYVAAASALLFIVSLLTFFIFLAVRLINS